jgi:hypothetical protein
MHARVTRFEGGDADAIRANIKEIRSRSEEGPPEGVPSNGFTMLADPESGTVIAIGFFEDEEKLRQGDAVLNEMSPPHGEMGNRVAVEFYEVGLDIRI